MSAMWKKMLAPILITVLLVAWFAVWLIGCALLPIPWFGRESESSCPLHGSAYRYMCWFNDQRNKER